MAKLTDNQKSLIILGGGVVLAIGCGVGIYFDMGERDKLKEEIAVLQTQKAANDVEIAKIPGFKRELVAYRKIVSDNAKILPTEDDINAFIRDLASMEKDSGISIRTLPTYSPTGDKKVAAITRFPMKMQLTATTRSFLKFLNALENRERLVSVIDFRINPAAEDEKKPRQELEHDVTMSFDLYRYDPKTGAGGAAFPVKREEELQLLESKEVKDLVAQKGRPANVEHYQLLPGRDNRRDLFSDPRRRTTPDPKGGVKAEGDGEEVLLQALELKFERLKLELESYRNAEQSKDFLRMAASRRSFLKAKEEIDRDMAKISARNPEFKSRDLQDKYQNKVKGPYNDLLKTCADLLQGTGPGGIEGHRITETMTAGMRKELQDLMTKRMFKDAEERWTAVENLIRDAGKLVDDDAKPHVEAMKAMGEHAHFQALLAEKKLVVQGFVRMEKASAAIVNGRTLFPGKSLDKETIFLRVEEGGKGEADKLIFKLQGHEVDYVQPKPPMLSMDKAILTQD
jgi:Tfp pilus assembly protein PilO